MSKKDTSGQLNMFDFFGGDVQMVSLMPDDEFFDDAIGGGITGGFDGFEEFSPEDDSADEVMDKAIDLDHVSVVPVSETEKEPETDKEDETAKESEQKEEIVASKDSKPKTNTKRQSVQNGYHLTIRDKNKPVMHRCFSLSGNKADGVVAYLDYNRVYVKEPGKSAVCYQFQSAKQAVDYYIISMERMGQDGVMKAIDLEPVILPVDDIEYEETK